MYIFYNFCCNVQRNITQKCTTLLKLYVKYGALWFHYILKVRFFMTIKLVGVEQRNLIIT